MNSEFVEVAIIGRCVGLKGCVKLHNKGDFPEQFKKNAVFFDKDGNEFIIKSYDVSKETALFEGYEDIDLAKSLVNKILYTTKELTRKNCKLKEGEFFYFDVLGLNIVENGEILGVVKDIEDNLNNALLYVKTSDDLVSIGFAKNFYVPYIDRFVISVSLENKEILTKDAKSILENS
ncbi:ribosome maturation factor RimM [Campylobacter curvus]|uniref:Ribosome maturation factor RimM n=1 Tax=Campylobacter curvus (strain 525.92) TaxID=360105 RepID=RIMM_CAMC5|nr:ribosome maturation factor RimM [Campylobacter curvus]A7GZB2.1 RecName: Full=Ribosome maturation factor RimM [Campylobacter curvus 525.92]EAU00410.1 16S rRNA processing protein [Campylobacter curvus 525.92]